MSEQKKKLVEAITPINEDFAQWYTDVCLKAELVDYSTVKGCMILRPLRLRHLGEHHPHPGRDVQGYRP